MNLLLFYFSGTGNTWWVAQQVQQQLQAASHEVDLISIEVQKIPEDSRILTKLNSADMIGFCYPVYGANLPPIMFRFIQKIIDWNQEHLIHSAPSPQKETFVITTVGYINAFGPFLIKSLLKQAGFFLQGHLNIVLCNNASVPGLKVNPLSETKLLPRKENAIKHLTKFLHNILNHKRSIHGIGPYLIGGYFIRRFFHSKIQNQYQNFGVDESRCKQCLICVKNCPTQAIHYDQNHFHFSADCTACMRCYNFCPTQAILVYGKYADPAQFLRYHGPDPNFFKICFDK
jgi:Pyruvate/2-oxoacid:ferredoxin oxidoreductase delta subunit